MKTVIASLTLTLAAYTDTAMGMFLRSIMTLPIGEFDRGLASYIIVYAHF